MSHAHTSLPFCLSHTDRGSESWRNDAVLQSWGIMKSSQQWQLCQESKLTEGIASAYQVWRISEAFEVTGRYMSASLIQHHSSFRSFV